MPRNRCQAQYSKFDYYPDLTKISHMEILQRPDWHGSPIDLGELFIVKKNGRQATCKLRSHQFGWELLLFVGAQIEVVQTQVCRS